MPFIKHGLRSGAFLLFAAAGSGISWASAVQTHLVADTHVGEVYQITKDVETASKGDSGSTGSSTDRDTIMERVLGVRPDGLEFEYDLPEDATEQDRESNWQFPIRVFKPFSGAAQLLNRAEIEARLNHWLKKGGIPRAACGHWVFTWNAFKIDCDPQSALATVEGYDLGVNDLRDGLEYNDPEAASPIILRKSGVLANGTTFSGSALVDPEEIRREQAKSDLIVAEIMKKTLSLADAIRARSKEAVSGTIAVSFETDASGFVRKRTTTTNLELTTADGKTEHRTVTEVLKRQMTSGRASQR